MKKLSKQTYKYICFEVARLRTRWDNDKDNRLVIEKRYREVIKEFNSRTDNWFWTKHPIDKIIKEQAILEKMKKAKHSRTKCMECSKAPEVEVMWANGMAHAWFCNKCYGVWKKKEFKLNGKMYTYGEDINKERKIDGEASKKWSEPIKKADDWCSQAQGKWITDDGQHICVGIKRPSKVPKKLRGFYEKKTTIKADRGYRIGEPETMDPREVYTFEVEELGNEHLLEEAGMALNTNNDKESVLRGIKDQFGKDAKVIWLGGDKERIQEFYGPGEAYEIKIPEDALILSDLGDEGQLWVWPSEKKEKREKTDNKDNEDNGDNEGNKVRFRSGYGKKKIEKAEGWCSEAGGNWITYKGKHLCVNIKNYKKVPEKIREEVKQGAFRHGKREASRRFKEKREYINRTVDRFEPDDREEIKTALKRYKLKDLKNVEIKPASDGEFRRVVGMSQAGNTGGGWHSYSRTTGEEHIYLNAYNPTSSLIHHEVGHSIYYNKFGRKMASPGIISQYDEVYTRELVATMLIGNPYCKTDAKEFAAEGFELMMEKPELVAEYMEDLAGAERYFGQIMDDTGYKLKIKKKKKGD